MRANTYCMNYPIPYQRCSAPIPVTERYCESCKKLRERPANAQTPPSGVSANPGGEKGTACLSKSDGAESQEKPRYSKVFNEKYREALCQALGDEIVQALIIEVHNLINERKGWET